MSEMDKMLSVTEAAKILGITTTTVRTYIRRGLLPGATKIRGTQWQIPRVAIEFFDSVNIAGVFAKKQRAPFCKVVEVTRRDVMEDSEWVIKSGDYKIWCGDSAAHAYLLAEKLNEAADDWANGD